MLFILFCLIVVILFDLAALQWGSDSREPIHSVEWYKRAQRGLIW
jgi:hypothetical protein